MKDITIKEAHDILLEIAKSFAQICDENNIPYYMLGGTMLGAIRHNGFIPWDDDMDFGVPRKYYDKLSEILENNLPSRYKCCTYRNGREVSVIMKIDDERTIISDIHNGHDYKIPIGLNIDIFPLDYCGPNDNIWKKINFLRTIINSKYAKNSKWTFKRKLLNCIVKILVPFSRASLNEKIESLLKNMPECPYMSNMFGAWGVKECIPLEWYGNRKKFKFENVEFCGIEEYDKYLTQLYGNYMIPPEGDKHVHLNGVYWKD